MVHWTNRFLDEKTVVWDPPTRDGLGGYVWGEPEQVWGRWQYTKGPTVVYSMQNAQISWFTCVWIDREIETGSYLWKGLVSDLPDPDQTSDALQAKTVTKVRSIPTQNYLYKVYLEFN